MQLRDKLINSTSEGIIDPIYLSRAIKINTAFSSLQVDSICEMMKHENEKVRFSAFSILYTDLVPNVSLRKWLGVATKDINDEIRESAILLESKL